MDKTKVIEHHLDFIEFARVLRAFDEELLRKPITEGKWSIVEIIGHLIAWDKFILRDRIPYFFSENTFPAGPDVAALNERAAASARGRAVAIVLAEFSDGRTQLVEILKGMPNELWVAEIQINQSKLTLCSYFQGLMEHDLHHLAQMKEMIKS
ncbi:DinB family protein [Metasolibacillus meyeri]|uniref:DinB family protein n=1 Tax=Metasolibacillus meyeri TaxID=1071052 RepID=A0AAW9NQN0_9BACL|nr:DinB family protein [Metasolibacillus meyeri]MEC1177086.1 DinB family protein [Metasolibacillus meyeri]